MLKISTMMISASISPSETPPLFCGIPRYAAAALSSIGWSLARVIALPYPCSGTAAPAEENQAQNKKANERQEIFFIAIIIPPGGRLGKGTMSLHREEEVWSQRKRD
jgi:hypothetical protein